jgi:molybdate transport system regulatory protein
MSHLHLSQMRVWKMKKPRVRLRLNMWLENEQGILFGMGRYILLQQVEKHGSLKQAAESMNMSYRAAWGKMKQAEDILGQPLIEKQGSNRIGYRLTDLGKDLMTRYRQWLEAVEDFAAEKSEQLMGIRAAKYKEEA